MTVPPHAAGAAAVQSAQEVLNRYMWVETASAFSLQMAKVGLVGIYGAATPDAAGQLVNVIVSHFHRLVGT